jgi:hypothetical protein
MILYSKENIKECTKDLEIEWAKNLHAPLPKEKQITVTFTLPERYVPLHLKDEKLGA